MNNNDSNDYFGPAPEIVEAERLARKEWKKNPANQFRKWNSAWNASGASSYDHIGHCMALCERSQPENYDDWYRFYLYEAGYSAGLLQAAWMFHTYTNERFAQGVSFEEAKKHALIHAIDETYDGYLRETSLRQAVIDRLHEAGYTEFHCRKTDDETDERYAIDAEVICPDGKVVAGIQIKPGSFFAHFPKAPQWRLDVSEKHKRYAREVGAVPLLLSYRDERIDDFTPVLRMEKGRVRGGTDICYYEEEELLWVLIGFSQQETQQTGPQWPIEPLNR